MTRLKLDENLPSRAALVLRRAGFDVSTVQDEDLGGSSDSVLFQACAEEQRALVTLDLDFADIRAYGSLESPGIVVVRSGHADVTSICDILERSAHELAGPALRGSIWILEPSRIRTWRADS